MCKEMVKKIYSLSKKCGISQIAIITNHLKFLGTLYGEGEREKNDGTLTLTDAKIWRLKDVCKCGESGCKCDGASFCSADWLHVNVSKIVAFSLKK
ncbi:MAG: hypothetical protein WCY19_04420 [Candidatus Gastranaerophilaceae bacterium]